MKLFMLITADRLELPIMVSDQLTKISLKVGISLRNLSCYKSKQQPFWVYGQRVRVIDIFVDDQEDDEAA